MTVETNDTVDRYPISGVGPYAFSFRVFDEGEVTVTAISAGLVPTTLAFTTHYSVSGVNDEDGGSVTLTVVAAATYAGYTLDIRSNTVEYQPTSIRNIGRFLPEIHEDAFDRLSRQIQDLSRKTRAALRYPDDEITDGAAPSVASRKGRYLFANASTGAWEWVTSISTTTLSQQIFNQYLTDGLSFIYELTNQRTSVEIAAGVTPANYAIPSDAIGVTFQGRYTTYENAVSVADQAGIPIIGNGRSGVSTNTVLGRSSMTANTTGSQNSAIGKSALEANTTGNDNVGVGFSSLKANTTGEKNTSVGSFNLTANTTGSFNSALGQNCLTANTTGNENSAVGQGALFNNTTGSDNTAVGEHSLLSNTTANDNAAFGAYALEDNTTGANNCAFGRNAAKDNTTGHENSVFGKDALQVNSTGAELCAFGHGALTANTTASGNSAFGKSALLKNTTGTGNTATGRSALQENVTGTENSAFGENALVASTGNSNAAFGKNALLALAGGGACAAFGHGALTNATGGNNTAIGQGTGATLTSGTENTLLGFQANTTATAQNSTSVGNGATCTASHQVTLGNASVATLRCQQTSITALSDARFKTEIAPLDIPDEFLDEVEIVTYRWTLCDMPKGQQVGVIAQQLDALQNKYGLQWLGLVDKTNPDRWEATPGKLLFPLIVRAQRLTRRVSALESQANR